MSKSVINAHLEVGSTVATVAEADKPNVLEVAMQCLVQLPACTEDIQLCRALKTKHETPKYGLIYHASLIGQAAPKFKGKISRVLAAKCALSIRVDALGEAADATIGLESRTKVCKAVVTMQPQETRLSMWTAVSTGNAFAQ